MKQDFLCGIIIAFATYCNGISPAYAQTPPDVHVCGAAPSTFDESHYTVGRPERHQKTESSESAFSSGCCTYDVLETALIYPSGTVFNSEIWKANSSKRFAMLFDLYHRHLKDFSPEQVFSLLGLPDGIQAREKDVQTSSRSKQITEIFGAIELPRDAHSARSGEHQISYDLGWQKGRKTFLELSFTNGELKSLQLKRIRNSMKDVVCTPWQCANLTWEGMAQDYNRKYMIVGMPADLVARMFPASDSSTGAIDSSAKVTSPIEVQVTPDDATVQRFRISYETASESKGITEWVSENLRTDERCLARQSDYLHLRSLSPYFPSDLMLDWGSNFNKKSWKEALRNLRGTRLLMINSLLRTYPVIGMTRKDFHALVGRGEVAAYLQSTEIPTDSLSCDSEFYLLSIPMGCGNVGVDRLQIAYRNDLVCGYRIISSKSFGLGEISLSGSYEFE